MKLYAIGDLHLGHRLNKEELANLRPHPDDGLILVGDIGETPAHLELAFAAATRNFAQVFWCPGNHELYSLVTQTTLRGRDKYQECVDVARRYGVKTPEDPYTVWEAGDYGDGDGGPVLIAPVFALYDYSFRPAHVSREGALKWAEEADTVASDEFLLHPDPYPTREAWCEALVAETERRLEEAIAAYQAKTTTTSEQQEQKPLSLVIANHWPLREDLIYIPRVPRFTLWCGTKRTANWHTRFHAKVVVSGHLHVPRTDWRDGTRFEECSLGYPRQWEPARAQGLDINDCLREILPGPAGPPPAPVTAGVDLGAGVGWRRRSGGGMGLDAFT
ncbi:metallophosphoesterase-like protein [Apiospora phragmitis]|uniref:Metallophosphoesterase-like protein n=1 Tax=Apiospora phragmitis TaxID=2905665 RepID=A0ABR1USU9_9PEZI